MDKDWDGNAGAIISKDDQVGVKHSSVVVIASQS